MDQAHLFRNIQPFGFVGRSPVQDHDETIIRVGVSDLIQKLVHAFGIHFFCRHEVESTILGAHSRIFVGEFPHQGQRDHRAKWSGSQQARGSVIRPNRASS